MNALPVEYRTLKETAINLASLGIPLGFLCGFLYGKGQWQLGSVVLGVYFLLDNISGRLWFKVLEKMPRR